MGDSVSGAASVASSRLERAVSYHAFLSLLPRIVLPTIVLPKIAEKNSIANNSIANPNDEKVDNVLVPVLQGLLLLLEVSMLTVRFSKQDETGLSAWHVSGGFVDCVRGAGLQGCSDVFFLIYIVYWN